MEKNHAFKYWSGLCAALLFMGSVFTACSRTDLSALVISTSGEDPFEQKEEELEGYIAHSFQPSESRMFSYSGGVLSIPYSITAEGTAAKVGFLLFLDGIPQPYQVEDEEFSAYQYMHLMDMESNPQKSFSFRFEPVTGKSGETLELQILSVSCHYPDSQGQLPLGTTQSYLPLCGAVHFTCDAAETDYGLAENIGLLLSARTSSEELTLESIAAYTGNSMMEEAVSNLNTDISSKLFLNEKDSLMNPVFDMSQGMAELKHVILGHPGVKYRTVLFLDYEPLWFDGENNFPCQMESGSASLLEAELDFSGLEGRHVLSALSIPRNASDYPDDIIEINALSLLLDWEETE